jgi:hypothetical protein
MQFDDKIYNTNELLDWPKSRNRPANWVYEAPIYVNEYDEEN